MPVTNYPNGISVNPNTAPYGRVPFPDRIQYVEYWNDFECYLATEWVVTETQGAATQAVVQDTGANGSLKLVNSTSANDVNQLQLSQDGGTTAMENFLLDPTKSCAVRVRFSIEDADQNDLFFGLCITDTTATSGTDMFGIKSTAGVITGIAVKNSTTTSLAIGTAADATYVDAAIVYDADFKELRSYLNGVLVAKSSTLTNICDDELLAVTVAQKGLDTGGDDLFVDYIHVIQMRSALVRN